MLTIVKREVKKMKVILCGGGTCETVKNCPAVEINGDVVTIGEDENICTLTLEQFNIMKEKILAGEL